jgi:uncharacterized protein YneF (UPF0154 family)
MSRFTSPLRLICTRVCQLWPMARSLALLATVIGALLVTVGMIQVFGGTRLPANPPWTLEAGTAVLGLTLVLFALYAVVVLGLHALLACVALGNFVSRKTCRLQQGQVKERIKACLLKVAAILSQKRTGH